MATRLKIFITSLLAFGLFAFSSLCSVQAATEIRLGHVGEPGSLMEKTAKEFAKRANEQLGDEYKVETYGSSQLGSDTEMLRKLKLGTIDLALPSTVMSSVDPAFAVFEMPFLIKDRKQVRKIQQDEDIVNKLSDAASQHGYVLLALWENGFRDITNNVRPIKVPEDLKGVKLRTPNGEWRVRMFKAYGANPTPMPYSEVFVALQTGAVDGEENPLAQIYPGHFYEVQKYLSISHHVYTPIAVLSGASWQRLPENVRDVLKKTALEMEPVALKFGAELDKELLVKLKDKGMKVNDIDREAFVDASKPIYQEYYKAYPDGKKMVEEIRSLED